MEEYLGGRLTILLAQLRELEQALEPIQTSNLSGPGAEAAVREVLGGIAKECERLKLSSSLSEILKERLDSGSLPQILAMSFGLLHETIERELKKSLFLIFSPDEAEQYRNPTVGFAKTLAAFPKAATDIGAARQCYLLGQDTACVFHCMGILQQGLFALAETLDVSFPWSIELEKWGTIIDQIEKAIREKLISRLDKATKNKGQTLPRGNERDERDKQLQFHSELATRFAYFKDAWRNHVCHLRERYDHDQALLVLTSVKDFMELLSSRLKQSDYEGGA